MVGATRNRPHDVTVIVAYNHSKGTERVGLIKKDDQFETSSPGLPIPKETKSRHEIDQNNINKEDNKSFIDPLSFRPFRPSVPLFGFASLFIYLL